MENKINFEDCKSYLHGNFCFRHLIGNIMIINNKNKKIVKNTVIQKFANPKSGLAGKKKVGAWLWRAKALFNTNLKSNTNFLK